MDENVQRNLKRINLQLKPLVNAYSQQQKEVFKAYKILYNENECKLEDIDFNKSLLFICNDDFLSYISYYGMLKINNVKFPDETQAGTYSMIRTSYMIIDSQDIRFSKIPMDSFYDLKRDGLLPESWNSINYVKKDVCLWRLVSSVGIGDNDKMYEGCSSWITERYRNGKIDWLFYIGTYELFKKEYTEIAKLNIPVYRIVPNGTKVKQVNTTVSNGSRKDKW